jgi:hypothetical protein
MNRNGTESVRTTARNLNAQLATQMKERPYAAIGLAAGAGIVAGSILGSRIAQLGVAAAAGYLARDLLEGTEVGAELRRMVDSALRRFAAGAGKQAHGHTGRAAAS